MQSPPEPHASYISFRRGAQTHDIQTLVTEAPYNISHMIVHVGTNDLKDRIAEQKNEDMITLIDFVTSNQTDSHIDPSTIPPRLQNKHRPRVQGSSKLKKMLAHRQDAAIVNSSLFDMGNEHE